MAWNSDARPRALVLLTAFALVSSFLLTTAGRTGAHTGDWIDSAWTTASPAIDGSMAAGEWSDATAIDLMAIGGNQLSAWLLIKNDANFLYVAYDAVGDRTNDMGAASISFDTGNDLLMDVGREDEFCWGNGINYTEQHLVSDGNSWIIEDSPFDTGLPNHTGLASAIGFGPSDLNSFDHRIFELQVPLVLLSISPGDVVGFIGASRPAWGVVDYNTFDYSTWPFYMTQPPPLAQYGDLRLGRQPQTDDLDLNPPSQSQFGLPLGNVTYPITVVNLGTSTDIFDVQTLSIWTATLLDSIGSPLPDTDGDTIPDTGSIAPAGSVQILVRIDIPTIGVCDDATITGTSSNDISVFDTALLHTCTSGARLHPPHSDYGDDTDFPPNGLFNWLVIEVGVDVGTSDFYQIRVNLYNETGAVFITTSSYWGTISSGYWNISVNLDGVDIYLSGIDGPYLAQIELYDGMSSLIDTGNHTTASYLHTDFEPAGARLNPPHSDHGYDSDFPPNGFFDQLVIDISVTVNTAGPYQAFVELFNETGVTYITSSSTWNFLSAGPTTIPVNLQGNVIYNSGIDGPYLALIRLYDGGSNLVDTGNHTTAAYVYTDFEPPGAMLAPPHSDQGVDTDVPPNGFFDFLQIDVSLTVTSSGYYEVSISLYDQTQTWFITSRSSYGFLSSGPQTVQVSLYGRDIYDRGIDGPYFANINVYDDFYNLLGTGNHLTASYKYTEFEPPAALFNPPHSDFGNDSDVPPDGLYDSLVINVSVTVNSPGQYMIGGPLYDRFMFYITSSSTTVSLTAGNHIVPFAYPGRFIFDSSRDGPYTAQMQLSDMNSSVDFDTYTTGPYGYMDFEGPPGRFQPPHSDYALDLTAPPDGLYEFLVVNASVEVTSSASFQIGATLRDSTGVYYITSATSQADLDVGLHQVPLEFDGLRIYGSGIDGPYRVEMDLYDQYGYLDYDRYFTAGYQSSDFSPPGAVIMPPHSDHILDTDVPPDGLADFLVADIGVNVIIPGRYLLTGLLESPSAIIDIDSGCGVMLAGSHTCPLEFDGPTIFETGVDRTYMIELSLYDEYGRFLDWDYHLTSFYTRSQFEPPDNIAPVSTAGVVSYWRSGAALAVPFTASDGAPTNGLASVTLYYRHSADNASWGPWTSFTTKLVSGATASGSMPFTYPSGAGYYEFQMVAMDNDKNLESLGAAEARVAYIPLLELSFTPDPAQLTAGQQTTVRVDVLSADGGPATLVAPLTVSLLTDSLDGQFREVGGSTAITQVTIPAGQSSVSFDYYDTAAGTWTLEGLAPGTSGGDFVAHVAPATASSISIHPPSATIYWGTSIELTARIADAYGNAIGGASVSWTVSGPGRLSVQNGGATTLTSDSPGTITVTAASGSISAVATITAIDTAGQPSNIIPVGIGGVIAGLLLGVLVGWLMRGRRKVPETRPVTEATEAPPPSPPPEAEPPGTTGQS